MLVKKVLIDRADRFYQMPPDILDFARPLLSRPLLAGSDMIDLGSFSWPVTFSDDYKVALDSLKPATPERLLQLKESLADWLAKYHGTTRISPREIFLGNGISSIVRLTAMAFIDVGDLALVPSLGVPLYRQATAAAGGIAVPYPMSVRRNWLPDIAKMSSRVGQAARLLFINSPHNPTGVDLDEQTLGAFVSAAAKQNTLLVNDACYQSVPTRKPLSLLSIDGGRKVSLEIYSFPYLFGLPRIPFGFAVGQRNLIAGLEQAASVFNQHIPSYYIDLALDGLRSFPSTQLEQTRKQFAATSAAAQPLIEMLGLEASAATTVPFIWAQLPGRHNSVAFARRFLKRYRILIAPGTGFGDIGQGFIRLSLTTRRENYAESLKRLSSRSGFGRRGGD